MASDDGRKKLHPLLKLALEMGPLGLFFLANSRPQLFSVLLPGFDLSDPDIGIYAATAVFMVTSIVALIVHYSLTRHLPVMPMVSGIVVLVFGALTLWLHDKTFAFLKPTIINSLFGAILLGGLFFGKSLITYVLDTVFDLTEEGWRKLTLRWGIFFFVLAGLNEIVWRNFDNNTWVNFKVFGVMPLTFLFAAAQVPLLMRHEAKKGPAE